MAEDPSVEGDVHEGNWYVLMMGLARPETPLTLAPGLTLVPLDSPLSVFDLAAAGAVGFREWAILEPVAQLCTCEIETAKDSDVTPGYDTLNRAWLASALLVLRGFSRHLGVACSSYTWNLIAGHQKRHSQIFGEQLAEEGINAAIYSPKRDLSRFKGNVLDFHVRLLIDKHARTDAVSPDDAAWTIAHFQTFNRLASESEAFRLALEAAIDWRYAKEPRLAVGRIWSGIEAVFGMSSELVYRISLLSASLLEERGRARKMRFQAVKKLYGLRSKAVHGEPLAQEQLVSAMNESYRLLRKLLLLTIEKGHILTDSDFDDAVFA
ncbi:hypothetical protein [Candidatus Methylomirabilis sp.]|uniref:hypothetical protein n=1 Tax=Candidatus Methylomirabilis sp. TaxID=2032687 RepID=UPI003076000B